MITSRRTFLKSAVALTAAAPLLRSEPKRSLVGTQLYGWGQYYEREGKKLYEHLDEVFPAIRDAGYDTQPLDD